MKTMEDLFYALLQDVYYAEKQLLKTLPKLAKKANNEQLEKAFLEHREQTEGHIERLEKTFEMIGKKAKGKKCDAILGIIAEGEEVLKEAKDAEVRDAGMIGAAQAAEHYEIARYGTLIAWADELGHDDILRLLTTNLNEEKAADKKLSTIALRKGVNRKAAS